MAFLNSVRVWLQEYYVDFFSHTVYKFTVPLVWLLRITCFVVYTEAGDQSGVRHHLLSLRRREASGSTAQVDNTPYG